jgi:hypothetical protein
MEPKGDFLEEIEKDLTCPLCLCLYNVPTRCVVVKSTDDLQEYFRVPTRFVMTV